jgi:hypothetical protein
MRLDMPVLGSDMVMRGDDEDNDVQCNTQDAAHNSQVLQMFAFRCFVVVFSFYFLFCVCVSLCEWFFFSFFLILFFYFIYLFFFFNFFFVVRWVGGVRFFVLCNQFSFYFYVLKESFCLFWAGNSEYCTVLFL